FLFFFQAEDGIRDFHVTGVQTCALPIFDHPDGHIDHATIFPRYIEQLKEAYFLERRDQIASMLSDMLLLLSDEKAGMPEDRRTPAAEAIGRLKAAGYCEHCGRAALAELVRERYA